MKYNVLVMGYTKPNPEKIKELLLFEQDYIKSEYPARLQNRILIFSWIILHQTDEINEETIRKARKNRIEYNIDFKDLDAKADCHGVHRLTIEI